MTSSKLSLLTILMLAIVIPTGFTYADSAVIDEFSIQSKIIQGENISVAITVSYDFTTDAELNPGIYSFESEDWIVDEIMTASGSDTVVYVLEFPAPMEDGTHLFQANVWYVVDDKWFIDGVDATHNFTITIGELNTSIPVNQAEIIYVITPENVDASSLVKVSLVLGYEFPNEAEIRLYVLDPESEIVSEEYSSLSGTNQTEYVLTLLTPETPGEYAYSINVEFESSNVTQVRKQDVNIIVIAPEEPEPAVTEPDTPDEPETPLEVTPPATTEPDPQEPEKTGGIPGFDIISILAGALIASQYGRKKN